MNENGIAKWKNYTFWIHAEVVKTYVKKYLYEKFPDSLIVPEFNQIDFVVMKENLPVEIQSTSIAGNMGIKHSLFEEKIRKQLEDNIENCSKCWFFFDAEYYRYLNETEEPNISLNLDWFAKYVKEDKLKVFTIKHDGLISELKYENLDFIRRLSSTCKIGYEDDNRILNRNKIKIMNNVLKGYNFTQDEIDKFYEDFENKEKEKNEHLLLFLLKQNNNNRARLYGYMLSGITALSMINDFLDMNKDFKDKSNTYAQYLGIVEIEGTTSGATTKFIDKFDICQYFPGYIRHKEWWDIWKKEGLRKDARRWREVFLAYHDKKQKNLKEWI